MRSRENSLIVLMYHGIHDGENTAGDYDCAYSISADMFEQHLLYLKNNHYSVLPLEQAVEDTTIKRKVVITFDDGDLSNYTTALPLLLKHEMKAEFFITTGRVGNDPTALSQNEILEMSMAGMSMQSHGVTHRYLADLSDIELYDELQGSKNYLEGITGKAVVHLSLPGGRGSDRVTQAAKKLGYQTICTSKFGINDSSIHNIEYRRITIYRQTDIIELGKLLNPRSVHYKYLLLRKGILDLVKKALGNRTYEKIYNVIKQS